MPDQTPTEIKVPLSQQPTIDVPPDAAPPWWCWIIDRNPMFLISGVLMLAGCLMVSQHIHGIDPIDENQGEIVRLLIGLLVVLNLYEFAVIGLGLVLSKTRTLVRDSRHLLGLALLLLVDAAFVYTETGTLAPNIGVTIATIATLLAWAKAWLIIRSLRIHVSAAAMLVTAISLAAMYALPIAVRSLAHDGFLTQTHAMAVWCGLGAVVALHALPKQWVRLGVATSADHRQLQRLVAAGLIALPIVSLIGHAAAALWVYENAFMPAMLSPILLGVALLILRHHQALGGAKPSAHAAALFVASAVVASLIPGEELLYQSEQFSWVAMSPLRGVLVMAPLVLGWAWWMSGKTFAGFLNTLLPVIAASLGHTVQAMLEHIQWIAESTTLLGWGTIAIGLSLLSLVFGSAVSWRRRTRERARAGVSELLAEPA